MEDAYHRSKLKFGRISAWKINPQSFRKQSEIRRWLAYVGRNACKGLSIGLGIIPGFLVCAHEARSSPRVDRCHGYFISDLNPALKAAGFPFEPTTAARFVIACNANFTTHHRHLSAIAAQTTAKERYRVQFKSRCRIPVVSGQ